MHTDPYDPLYDVEEETYEFDHRDPTLDECVRMWHEAIEWHKHHTLYDTADFAVALSEENPEQLNTWIKSVRIVREQALIDADTSYWLLWSIVDGAADAESVLDDPELVAIGDRMDAFCRAHGRDPHGDGGDFTYAAYQPPGWRELQSEFEERQLEMRREHLRAAGEHTMLKLMTEQPAEYARRQATVARRIKKDHAAERGRWMPLDDWWLRRIGLEDLIVREAGAV